jgi:predicted 3-demethylubiquinone-9 3-methyltransferase (glyoxalase superfamily)
MTRFQRIAPCLLFDNAAEEAARFYVSVFPDSCVGPIARHDPWTRLGAGGDPRAQQGGWPKDRFGASWQVVPTVVPPPLSNPDPQKAGRVMTAILRMGKITTSPRRSAPAPAEPTTCHEEAAWH